MTGSTRKTRRRGEALEHALLDAAWAWSRNSGATRQSSRARTRGGNRPASRPLSISQSGCG